MSKKRLECPVCTEMLCPHYEYCVIEEQALQPTNIDNEVEEVFKNFEKEFKTTCEELKSKGLSHMDAYTIIGNGLEYDWYEIVKPTIRKALTTQSVSPSHGIKEVQLTELEEK